MHMELLHRPVWAEIHLDNLKHNIFQVRSLMGAEKKLCAVIKANAYGHGAVRFALELESYGIDHLAVATLNEALELRKHGCTMPLLILGYTPSEKAPLVIDNDLKQTVYTLEQGKAFSKAAALKSKPVCLHIEIDTGMSRLGFQPTDQAIDEITEICILPFVNVEGLFTHFASADDSDKKEAMLQLEKYRWVTEKLSEKQCHIPVMHTANSAAIIDMPETHLDMVRAGIMIYGLYPSPEVNHKIIELKRVMALKARVAHVKEILPGTGVSYGYTYRASDATKVATLPVGYADGYIRMLGGKAEVMINGHKAPVIGRICMDQCMVDVTGIDVKQGDEACLYALIDEEGDTVDDVARKIGTINYEITCMVSCRVPRVYIKDGVVVDIWDPSQD